METVHHSYCNKAIGLKIEWQFNFECFLTVKFFFWVNHYQKLFKTIFLNFFLRIFLNFFIFLSFYYWISCQYHSFVNQLPSSFLFDFLSIIVVMGLGHLSSARAIRVRIPAGTNFSLHFAPTGSSVLWTRTCISGLVQTFASLYGLALAHLGLCSCKKW